MKLTNRQPSNFDSAGDKTGFYRSKEPKSYIHHSIPSVHNPLARQPVVQQPGLAGTVNRPNAKSK